MIRTSTRRIALALAAVFFAFGAMPPRRAGASGDFAILGVSMSRTVEVESGDLPGEWKDDSWRRVTWRVSRGGRPGEFLATRVRKDESEESFRAVLIHGKDRGDFLDLTPANGAPPEQSAPHLLFKLELTRVDGLSIGTPRRVRKAFDHHVAKSFHRLQLLPMKPASLREVLGEDSHALPGPLVEGPGKDIYVIANPTQVAEFLNRHGGESSFWKDARDGMTVVQRCAEAED